MFFCRGVSTPRHAMPLNWILTAESSGAFLATFIYIACKSLLGAHSICSTPDCLQTELPVFS